MVTAARLPHLALKAYPLDPGTDMLEWWPCQSTKVAHSPTNVVRPFKVASGSWARLRPGYILASGEAEASHYMLP